MKKVKELFNRKIILSIISMFVIAGLSFVYISNTNKELKKVMLLLMIRVIL